MGRHGSFVPEEGCVDGVVGYGGEGVGVDRIKGNEGIDEGEGMAGTSGDVCAACRLALE